MCRIATSCSVFLSRKEDFLSDPEAFRLRGDDLPLDVQVLWKVIYTTGTTSGKPAPIYVPAFDNFAYLFACARRQDWSTSTTDVLANLFPLTPFPMGAYSRSADEAAAAGAAIVYRAYRALRGGFPVHHSLDEAVGLIERHRATFSGASRATCAGFWCAPASLVPTSGRCGWP